MVFSSILFLFYFFPAFFALYYACRRSNLVILFGSLFFYAWGEPANVGVLVGFIIVNWLLGRAVAGSIGRDRRIVLMLAVGVDVGFLVYFKYLGFLAAQVAVVAGAFGLPAIAVHHVALPLGVSFFTFQGISYLIDVHRGTVPVQRDLLRFATYKAMFPQLVAGPIVRYRHVAGKIAARQVSLLRLQYGLALFIIGLSQKVLIANTVAGPADDVFNLPLDGLTPAAAWLGVFSYTLQIYFDFAGYSNMAIGMGHMMGFGFPPNFDRPYASQSITEFWRRWHMSLSSWLRDYLYIPLGGNRRGRLRTYGNLIAVFLICGLWHGASWNFAVWGLWHGLFLVIERAGFGGVLRTWWRLPRHVYAVLVVAVGWVFFRCDTLAQAGVFLAALCGLTPADPLLSPIDLIVSGQFAVTAVIACLLAVAKPPHAYPRLLLMRPVTATSIRTQSLRDLLVSTATRALLLLLLVLSALRLATGSFNPFIYFRF